MDGADQQVAFSVYAQKSRLEACDPRKVLRVRTCGGLPQSDSDWVRLTAFEPFYYRLC